MSEGVHGVSGRDRARGIDGADRVMSGWPASISAI
jgi:hypothetical protein